MGPVLAPTGTMAFTAVAVTAVGVTVTGPVNVTPVVPARFRPLIVTNAPTGAAAGTSVVGLGGWSTAKGPALVTVPSTVVTLILPVTAASGTRNWMSVAVAVGVSGPGIVMAPILTIG